MAWEDQEIFGAPGPDDMFVNKPHGEMQPIIDAAERAYDGDDYPGDDYDDYNYIDDEGY